MIAGFAIRAVVAALLMTGAGLAAEQVAAWYGRGRRWVWAVVILASLVLPAAARWTPTALARSGVVHRSAVLMESFEAPSSVVLAAPSAPEHAVRGYGPSSGATGMSRVLQFIWLAVSAALLLSVVAAYVRLRRVRTRAERADIDGAAVHITERTGPAVIGFLHPAIVLPRSVITAPAAERRLIILHEREHIDARDPWLLAFGALAAIAMPWNVLLWWQAARLRLAVETDCDARVLAHGTNRELYGRTLIRTAGDSLALPMLAPAWGDRASQLQQRILAMTARPPRARFALGVLLCVFAGAATLVACAATAGPRNAPDGVEQPAAVAATRTVSTVRGHDLPGDVRVTGYTREHLPVRLVLTGTGVEFGADSNGHRLSGVGDTVMLDVTTPTVVHILTNGTPSYRLIARAVEPGTEVEIRGATPVGYGYPSAASARGPAPMFNFTRDGIRATRDGMQIVPLHEAVAPSVAATSKSSTAVATPPEQYVAPETSMFAGMPPGHIRVFGDDGVSTRLRVDGDVPFAVISAAATYTMGDGHVELLAPAEIEVKGAGDYAIVFDPVDRQALFVAARGRPGDRFITVGAGVNTRPAGSPTASIVVCQTGIVSGVLGAQGREQCQRR